MTPERWERVQELYHGARACAEADRAPFLIDACAGDEGCVGRSRHSSTSRYPLTASFTSLAGRRRRYSGN
jgi:hypothetical protein